MKKTRLIRRGIVACAIGIAVALGGSVAQAQPGHICNPGIVDARFPSSSNGCPAYQMPRAEPVLGSVILAPFRIVGTLFGFPPTPRKWVPGDPCALRKDQWGRVVHPGKVYPPSTHPF